jgi:hypothetical protein
MKRCNLIPDSLHQFYLSEGWNDDYWKEIPVNWTELSDDDLSLYPITKVILGWRKHTYGREQKI